MRRLVGICAGLLAFGCWLLCRLQLRVQRVAAALPLPATGWPVAAAQKCVDVPPDVQGGGIFTMTGTKNFTQTFTGADGQHTYSFQTGQA